METKISFPLYSPGKCCDADRNHKILVADLRNINSSISLYSCIDETILKSAESTFVTSGFSSLAEMVKTFLEKNPTEIQILSIAVPGPVINGKCVTPHLPWTVDTQEISTQFGIARVCLINDLEAIAYSLADLDSSKLQILHTSSNKVKGNIAILAPGNGLGEAGLFWDGKFLRPFATEGGHTEFSPRNELEIQFYQFLTKIYGIVTWENVLSKEGMYNIYRFLRDVGRHHEDAWLAERIQHEDFLTVIGEVGREKKSRLVNLTLEMYAEFLAREANNLVLKLKATGALIITGEIPETVFDDFSKDKFYKDFTISDRMEHLLKDIPIYLVHNDSGISDGAAYYGAFTEV